MYLFVKSARSPWVSKLLNFRVDGILLLLRVSLCFIFARLAKDQEEPLKDDGVIKIMTDDKDVPVHVRSKRDLPLNRYTSLGVVLDTKGFAEKPVTVTGPPNIKMSSRPVLTPVPPEKETAVFPARLDPSLKQQAPLTFGDMVPKRGPLALTTAPLAGRAPPPTHEGVVWPLAWAREPPYAAPGYHRPGAKQPIGR